MALFQRLPTITLLIQRPLNNFSRSIDFRCIYLYSFASNSHFSSASPISVRLIGVLNNRVYPFTKSQARLAPILSFPENLKPVSLGML